MGVTAGAHGVFGGGDERAQELGSSDDLLLVCECARHTLKG